MIKKILICIMSTVLVLSIFSILNETEVSAQETNKIICTGKYGKNLKYTVYSDGLLKIDGTGAIPNASFDNKDIIHNHLYPYRIKKIEIGNGITSIGKAAFMNNEIDLVYVRLPKSIKIIGENAFYGTRSLEAVSLPEGLEKIGKQAFAFSGVDCKKGYYTIPKSVKYIGEDAFQIDYHGLRSEVFHKLKVYYGTYAYKYVKSYNEKVTEKAEKFKYDVLKFPINEYHAIMKKSSYIYTGKQIKPNITVKSGKTTLKKNIDYTVSYKNNIKTGKATVKITGKGNYTGSITKTFYIVPKAPTGLKLTTRKKNIKVSYKKSTGASGYQIAYSTSKSKGFKYITVNSKTASKVIKKLKSKKKYYVKVRAYKTVGKKKYYGSYTSIKSIKVK